MPIRIARGQRKTVRMQFFQGDDTTPRVDLTNALFSIDDANYPAQAVFQAVDLAQGEIDLVIEPEHSELMVPSRINWFTVKTTIGTWEDVTDPIEFEVRPA